MTGPGWGGGGGGGGGDCLVIFNLNLVYDDH